LNEQKKKERLERKARKRQEEQERQKENEAHLTSYINREQFNMLYESIDEINKKITDHSVVVDELEQKLLQVNRKRRERLRKKKQSSSAAVS